MTIILTNKYFFILLFLMLLNMLVYFWNKFPYVKPNQDSDEFLQSLHKYYVTNLYYDLFILFIYGFSYFGIFLLFRIKLLGQTLDIMSLSINSLNLNSFIHFLLYIFCIIFYIKIIRSLFYLSLIRLHYYFYQFPWYEDIIDNCHMQFNVLSDRVMSLAAKIGKYTRPKKDFDAFLEHVLELKCIVLGNSEKLLNFRYNQKKQRELWMIINNNLILFCVIYLINYLLHKFWRISRKLKYISYPLLFLLIIWEIHQGTFYYIYYGLMIYFLTLWIRKIRYFLSVRDPSEKAITDYFYNNEIPYLKIKSLLDNNDLRNIYNNIGGNTKTVLEYKDELISYMLNDFVVYHVRYPVRKANEKYLDNDARRSNVLILIFIAIIYYYVNASKYTLIISGIILDIYLLLIPLFLLQYFLYGKILFDTGKTSGEAAIVWAENRYYKNLSRLVVIIIAILTLYIMLKNKLMLFPQEVILEVKDCIKITENYTIAEKMKYSLSYLEIIIKALNLTEDPKTILCDRVQKELILDNKITLAMIRKQIEEIISLWVNEFNANKILCKNVILIMYEKIKNWLGK